MTRFSDIETKSEPVKPAHSRGVAPSVFSDSWKGKPRAEVWCGFRALSEEDTAYARSESTKRAWDLHPKKEDEENRWDAFNDCLMRLTVARGTCDPNDASASWDIWRGAPDDNVHTMLTCDGVRFLFDEVERAHLLASPLRSEATDEELLTLFDALPLSLPHMPATQAARARRMLAFVLDEITPYIALPTDA